MSFIRYAEPGEKDFRYFKLPDDKMCVFGREDHCDFQMIMDAEISREHFGIEKDEDGRFVVIDLGSRNGTHLNGRKLENETIELREGDEIRAGSQVFNYFEKAPGNITVRLTPEDYEKAMEQEAAKDRGFRTIMCEVFGWNK